MGRKKNGTAGAKKAPRGEKHTKSSETPNIKKTREEGRVLTLYLTTGEMRGKSTKVKVKKRKDF